MPAKRGAGKPAKKGPAPRKAAAPKPLSKQEINRRRLEADLGYYYSQEPKLYSRRTKSTKNHPRGIPLTSLSFENGYWTSRDGSVRLTDKEYERIALNPKAVPLYTPLHEDPNNRKKITGYRNSITRERVSTHYQKMFSRYFRSADVQGDLTEEQRTMAEAYTESIVFARKARASRHYNLAESYQLVHPEMSINQIVASEDFQNLVYRLETIHKGIETFGSREFVEDVEHAIKRYPTYSEEEEIAESIREQLSQDPEYAEVLVDLGRRTPEDTQPPGMSDINHIKLVVKPYYEGRGVLAGPTTEFEE